MARVVEEKHGRTQCLKGKRREYFWKRKMVHGRSNKISFKALWFLKNKVTNVLGGQAELRDRLETKWSWLLMAWISQFYFLRTTECAPGTHQPTGSLIQFLNCPFPQSKTVLAIKTLLQQFC